MPNLHAPAYLALCSALAFAGCAEAPLDGPVRLAHAGFPEHWSEPTALHVEQLDAPTGWSRLRFPIAPSDWQAWDWPGVWKTRLALPSTGAPASRPGVHELRVGERELGG